MPTERPLIPKDYKLAPKIPCTGTSAAFYLPVLTFHSINETQYNAMIADIPQIENNRSFRTVMDQTIDRPDANCDEKIVEIKINDASALQIKLLNYPFLEYTSCLPLSLFKGFKLLMESMSNFDENLCWFHFKKGECIYLNPPDWQQPVVVFTITYNGTVIGYYDVSTPPPII